MLLLMFLFPINIHVFLLLLKYLKSWNEIDVLKERAYALWNSTYATAKVDGFISHSQNHRQRIILRFCVAKHRNPITLAITTTSKAIVKYCVYFTEF
jgi:hypothetical protein